MHEAGGSQVAVDVVQLVLIGGDDVQLNRGVFAIGALTLVDAVIIDGRLDFYQAWQIITNSENLQTIYNSLLLGGNYNLRNNE